jgi:hypothetical protein
MRIVADLNRWQGSGRCVFSAATVFRVYGEESLE